MSHLTPVDANSAENKMKTRGLLLEGTMACKHVTFHVTSGLGISEAPREVPGTEIPY